MTTILKNNKKSIKIIYHISDIHIRNTEEHVKIYLHVFDNLYKYFNTVKSENSLIVITGDILHNKDRLTTTCETLCIDFFEKLSSIMTTIIIPGNHDFNEKNNTIITDSLTTILYKRNFTNLYYLRNSGIYRFNNILFGVSSIIDNTFIKASDITDDGIKIALFHGPVSNSTNSLGFEFSKNSITNFDGYDMVLLGDIHYYQYLNDDKTIAYASSLISQNFSETDSYHGVLVWDLTTKESKYKIIENEYRYDEIDIKNNIIFYKNKKIKFKNLGLPTKGKIRVNSVDCDLECYNKIIFDIKEKYPDINIVHNKLQIALSTPNKSLQNNEEINTNSIIENEIKKLPENTRKYVENILFKEIKSVIQNVDEKLNWKLLSLEFSNMFSYGSNNIIDFTKLTFDEITGIIGPNSIGKSSLIDILLFSLFDDYSRNYQDRNKLLSGTIINSKEKTFSCKVSFMIDNTIYYIEKVGKRMFAKTDYTFDTFKFLNYDFYKISNDNKIQLNGQDRFETLNKITNLIGNYDDFCIASVCLQNNMRDKIDFFNMSPLERKSFLNERLKFDVFKNIESKYKDLLKEAKINLKIIETNYEYINYDHNIDITINTLTDNINTYETKKITLKNNITEQNILLTKLYQQLKYIDTSYDIPLTCDAIVDDIKKYKNKLDKIDVDTMIDMLYNDNITLSSSLNNTHDSEYDISFIEDIEAIQDKINILSKSELIKNKETIFSNNLSFEEQKLENIVKFKSLISIPKNIFYTNPQKILNELLEINHFIITPNFDIQINNINNTIDNIEKNITELINTINYTEKILSNYEHVITTHNIEQLYNNISSRWNYDEYSNNMELMLKDYDKYDKLYHIIESNKQIFMLLNTALANFNNKCINCIEHVNNIKQLFTQLQIDNDVDIIIKKFNELQKMKNEYEQIIVHHNKLKLRKCKSILNINETILLSEKNNLTLLLTQSQDNTIINYKNKLEQHIYNIQLHIETNSHDYQYIVLNQEMSELNKLTDYINNKNILEKININKNKITELKNIKNQQNIYINKLNELNILLDNFNNSLYNTNIHTQIKQTDNNIQQLTNMFILMNNEYTDHNNTLKKLIITKNNYNKLIKEANEHMININIYENIIKLTGAKGIPRQIINGKLQYVENEVNNIINPFINKQIKITKEIEDIKIFIQDGHSKYNSTGGMETFIISIAFKIAFTHTFNLPQTGILFIDEGVSVLDKKHINNFNIISDFIKKYYNHIILITHIDSFFDYTFDIININKNKQKQSSVIFPEIIKINNDIDV